LQEPGIFRRKSRDEGGWKKDCEKIESIAPQIMLSQVKSSLRAPVAQAVFRRPPLDYFPPGSSYGIFWRGALRGRQTRIRNPLAKDYTHHIPTTLGTMMRSLWASGRQSAAQGLHPPLWELCSLACPVRL